MSAEIFSAFLGWSRLQLKEIDERESCQLCTLDSTLNVM